MDTLAIALTLSIAIKVILDYVADVVRRSAGSEDINLSWFDFIGLAAGLAIAWFAQLNIFTTYITNPVVGTVLTGLLMGGGSALINQVFASIQGRKTTILKSFDTTALPTRGLELDLTQLSTQIGPASSTLPTRGPELNLDLIEPQLSSVDTVPTTPEPAPITEPTAPAPEPVTSVITIVPETTVAVVPNKVYGW